MNPIHSSSSVSKYFNLEARDPAFDEMPFLLRSSGKGGQLYFMLSLSLILFVPVSRQTELIKISTNSSLPMFRGAHNLTQKNWELVVIPNLYIIFLCLIL